MQFILYLPIILGLVMLILAKPVGVAFCKFGKALWKAATFGKTDMAFFYPEDKAPMIMRICGGAFATFGIAFLFLAGFPFRGPGQFKAMSEAKNYLSEVYGSSSGGWKLSTKNVSEDSTVVFVEYQFGDKAGSLKGEWVVDRYQFTEEKKK